MHEKPYKYKTKNSVFSVALRNNCIVKGLTLKSFKLQQVLCSLKSNIRENYFKLGHLQTTMSDLGNDIMHAVNIESTSMLDMILTHKPDLDFTNAAGDTPLLNAVRRGHYDITKRLINAGADVNFPGKFGVTALMVAVENGNMDLYRLLLNSHADINAACSSFSGAYWSALDAAAIHGHCEIVTLLLEAGVILQVYDPDSNYTELSMEPMKSALLMDQPQTLELFLEHFNKTGQSVPWEGEFKYALDARADQCSIVIIQQGCYPMSKSSGNFSLFKMAADYGFMELVGIMVEQNPHFLQEDWLVNNYINKPNKLWRDGWLVDWQEEDLSQGEDFYSWLNKARKEVPLLSQLCKSAILTCMSPNPRPKIRELPLPKMLKAYLNLVRSAYEADGYSHNNNYYNYMNM